MSVVVRGMEMPETCRDCPCLRTILFGYQCSVTLRTFDVISQEVWEGRAKDCPLFEIKDWKDL